MGDLPKYSCGTCSIALGADAPRGIYMGSAFDPRHVEMHVISRRHAHAVLKLGSQVRPTGRIEDGAQGNDTPAETQRTTRQRHWRVKCEPSTEAIGSSRLDAAWWDQQHNAKGITMIPARKMCTFVRSLTLWESTVDEATVLMAVPQLHHCVPSTSGLAVSVVDLASAHLDPPLHAPPQVPLRLTGAAGGSSTEAGKEM